MTRIRGFCLALALAPWLAAAQPPSDRGQRWAALCANCHGAQGVSTTFDTPSLAGMGSFYAATQLYLFRAGRRQNAAMTAVGRGLTDEDLRGFSDFIGRFPPPPPPRQAAMPPARHWAAPSPSSIAAPAATAPTTQAATRCRVWRASVRNT